MPALNPKAPPPSSWEVELRAIAGASSRAFFALATSSEYDEQFAHRNPPSYHSPTSRYTHVFYYDLLEKHCIARISDRLTRLWSCSADKAYAVGFTRGVFELTPGGCREEAIQGIEGTLSGIWGVGEDHLFVCSMFDPYLLYRRRHVWQTLMLPEDSPRVLHSIAGFREDDVYVVGNEGTVLHFDGRQVRRLEIPTSRHLLSIAVLDNDHLCIGGQDGTLLYGNRRGWRSVPTGTDEPLYTLAPFRGGICFATPDGVRRFDGTTAPTLLVNKPARLVHTVNDAIVIVDVYDAWLYEGTTLVKLDTII